MTIWDEFIDSALIVYHTIKHMTTGIIPFLLVYGRKAMLPIDKSYNLCMKDRMMQIVEEVPHIREKIQCIIQHSQQRMIENDLKKKKLFQIGEEVLYHNVAKKK